MSSRIKPGAIGFSKWSIVERRVSFSERQTRANVIIMAVVGAGSVAQETPAQVGGLFVARASGARARRVGRH